MRKIEGDKNGWQLAFKNYSAKNFVVRHNAQDVCHNVAILSFASNFFADDKKHSKQGTIGWKDYTKRTRLL